MANRFVQLWRWQGTIDAKTYAIAGCSAFVLKYFLDKFVAGPSTRWRNRGCAVVRTG